jgi:RNA polymerase sigma-70 factor, ECF subfamily
LVAAAPSPQASAREARLLDTARHGNEDAFEQLIAPHRRELHAHCYRMLGSVHDAEDVLQEALLRAWRALARFERRSSLRSWLYTIATNACLTAIERRPKRVLPIDYGPATDPHVAPGEPVTESVWLEPYPDDTLGLEDGLASPEARYEQRESIELAFVAALQHLPPRQRAVLILCEVLRWQATEVAELLDTSAASVNSALQRARATLADGNVSASDPTPELSEEDRALLARYVAAFEAYDIDALTSLIQEDAQQSMPPYDMWLKGRDDIFTWWFGPGIGCKGSRVIPTVAANGSPAFGQYKPREDGSGYEPWALQVVELRDGLIGEMTFFLDTERLFPLFGLPLTFDA